MKAAFLVDKQTFKFMETPRPALCDGETLIAVRACGFCGSDLHDAARAPKAPRTPGHEFAGVVEETCGDSMGLKKGDSVIATPLVACGQCPQCLSGQEHLCPTRFVTGCQTPGGFAEFVKAPTKTVLPLPKGLSFEVATLADPLAVVLHALDLVDDVAGKNYLVLGAGTLGLFMLQVLKLRGAKTVAIADIAQQRLKRAQKFNPTVVIDAAGDPEYQSVKDISFDVTVELAGGGPTLEKAILLVRKGGTILQIAQRPRTEIPVAPLIFGERRLQGVFGQTLANFKQALAMLAGGDVDGKSMVTDIFTLDQVQQAFDRARSPESVKVIVRPN